MGQRANLVIIEGGKRTLYYDHWCANLLDVDLFWGPRDALDFIRQREPAAEPEGWLDTSWCEGAALLDLDHSLLVFFGGEDILWDVPLRRHFLDLLAANWKGWRVRWAPEGLLTITDLVGLPRSLFSVQPSGDGQFFRNEEFPENNLVLTSVRRADGSLSVHRLCGDEEHLLAGPDPLLALMPAADNPIVWEGEEFPHGGVHLDLVERAVHTWWAAPTADLVRHIQPAWPGWTVHWHQDCYEAHFALLEDRISLLQRPPALLRRETVQRLKNCFEHSARNPARELGPRLGKGGSINPATDEARGSSGDRDAKRGLINLLESGLQES